MRAAYLVYHGAPDILLALNGRLQEAGFPDDASSALDRFERHAALSERHGFFILGAELRLAACRVYEMAHLYPEARTSLDLALRDLESGGDIDGLERAQPVKLPRKPPQ